MNASAFAGDDMIAIKNIADTPWPQDYRVRSGDNLAIANEKLEFTARERGWSLGYFYRKDWWLHGNADTVDAYARITLNELAQSSRNYQLDYQLQGFGADGLKLGHSWDMRSNQHSGFIAGVSVSLLRGHDVRSEQVSGTMNIVGSNGTVQGDRSLYSTYTKPPFPQAISDGMGYGLDLGTTYFAGNGARVSFAVNDLFSQIKWDKVPTIVCHYNTIPVISQNCSLQNTYTPLTIKLDPKYALSGEYPLGRSKLVGQIETQDSQWFPIVGVRYALTQKWSAGMDYESRFGTVALSLNHANFYIDLASQSTSLGGSRAVGLSLGFHQGF